MGKKEKKKYFFFFALYTLCRSSSKNLLTPSLLASGWLETPSTLRLLKFEAAC